jgi:amino acid adenylation domain-containing protein
MTTAAPSLELRSTRAGDSGFVPRDGFEAFQLADAEQSIARRFSRIALGRGDATAVVDDQTVLTYRSLLSRASAIAAALSDRLRDRPGPIVLHLPVGASAIEALLGVLFAGRAYLFLDPTAPDGETVDTVAAAMPAAIVVDAAIRGVADEPTPSGAAASTPRIRLAELTGARTTRPDAERDAEPQDLACLFSTSGTSGTPKLVGLSHRAVLFDIGRQINDLCLGPDDRFDLLFSPSFSASLSPIFTALLSGGELHILEVRDHLAALGRWLERAGITVSRMTVSTFRALSATVASGDVRPRLRLLSVSGEPLLAKDVARFHAAFPASCALQNAMASTETRTYTQYFVPRGSTTEGAVPIGWPVYGKAVVLLDEAGRSVAEGQPGEIAVRSRFLAEGYTNDPDLTAKRFLPQPDGTVLFRTGDRGQFREDGCLLSLGRADSLVKIRGYRVEPEAVEAALATHERISHAAVIVHELAPGEPALAAYVVPCRGATVSPEDLRAHLTRALPAYSVPSSITLVESLPVTRHGKVDRRALPVPKRGGSVLTRSRPSAEAMRSALIDIWTEVLPRRSIGPGDNFFECGGDSLNALRLQLHLHERFGVDLPLDVLVRHPTLEGLADWLDRTEGSEPRSRTLTRLQPGGSGAPLFCVPGIGGEPGEFEALARRLGSDQPVYGFRAPRGGTEPVAPTSIEGIAANCLTEIDAIVPPAWPVLLCGHSFGGLVAFEIAQRLRAAGRRVGLVAIIDTPLARSDRRRLPRRVLDVLANLPAWIAYDALESSWRNLAVRSLGRAERLWGRVRAAFGLPAAGRAPNFRSSFGIPQAPIRFQEEISARFAAARNYHPQPYAGTVTLFRARARWLTSRRDRHLGWAGLALGGLEVFDVPGNHDSCLSERHVRHLADALKAQLEAAAS